MKRVGAVICNYNKSADVLNCIQSVLESKYTDYDLYVVDNASTDDSVEAIRCKYGSQVKLIVNEENLGGSGGFNTGLRAALKEGYEYLYCLDNDVLVDENAMGELVAFLDTHKDSGMAGSRVYNMEDPSTIQQFGQIVDFKTYCTEAKFLGKTDADNIPDVEYSDAVAACSLMVRRSLIEKIGLMPEENFLYWDDTEWGYRCNLAGFKVASVGSSVVLHRMGAKKEVVNTFPTYYAWRNWIRFFIKYTPEADLEKMCDTFLDSVFEAQYEGLYRGEVNRAKTVMYAFDDALNNVTGKAGAERIFEVDCKDEELRKIIKGKKCALIKKGRGEDFSYDCAVKLKNLNPDIEITVDESAKHDITFVMCDSIFSVNDMSLKNIYIDRQFNVFATEDDALKIINYAYSKEMFRFAHKPLFLHKAKLIREGVFF
jgi:hypothetical protein